MIWVSLDMSRLQSIVLKIAKKDPVFAQALLSGIKEAARTPLIETETSLMPWVIAESTILEVVYFANKEGVSIDDLYRDRDRIATTLSRKAEELYLTNERFNMQMNASGNRGRDQLYTFMRHWLSAILKTKYKEIFGVLPSSFHVGHPLPKN